MEEQMRKIERIIDNHHKSSKVFRYTRPTAILNALRVFEDGCRLGAQAVFRKTGDPLDYSMEIREQLNSFDIVLKWIFSECKPDSTIDLTCDKRYIEFSNLHHKYARQYFGIYNAYISYSRGRYSARINEKQRKITFDPTNYLKNIVVSNFTEALDNHNVDGSIENVVPLEVEMNLEASFEVVDKKITYDISEQDWREVKEVFEKQWIDSSVLPLEWVFDNFSLKEFKDVRVTIASWMWIHSYICLNSGIIGLALEEVVLVKKKRDIINFISQRTDVSENTLSVIVDYITYDPNIKNNDVLFQPFIPLFDDMVAFCPHLFLPSRPERNLITLIHKKKDKSYFNLTNLKENLMIKEITESLTLNSFNKIAVGVKLPDRLPDADLVIYNEEESVVLICELKWLTEADATHEVYAREVDIDHGCKQVQSIQQYALENSTDFMTRAFGKCVELNPAFSVCVISKIGIRTMNNIVPVISLNKFNELTESTHSLREIIHRILAKEYLSPAPPKFKIKKMGVKYANYTFELPGFVKQRIARSRKSKVGRNDLCPCGSKLKYKKCCANLVMEN